MMLLKSLFDHMVCCLYGWNVICILNYKTWLISLLSSFSHPIAPGMLIFSYHLHLNHLLFSRLQNSFISYDTLQKLGISQPVQFLQVLILNLCLKFGFVFFQVCRIYVKNFFILENSSLFVLSKFVVFKSNIVQICWRYTSGNCICSSLHDWDVGCCCWGCYWP